MIAKQRRAHRYIWIGIAVVLPIAMILAVKDLDFSTTDSPKASGGLPVSISLTGQSVHIQVHTPLKSTFSLVYEMQADGSRGKVLGQLEGRGAYDFLVSRGTKGIYVVDPIKNVELLKMEF